MANITLTTSWQKVAEASTKITSNITGYVRLYMKYGNRSGLNDTIYYEIRQFAYNPYGTYNAWQWLTPLAWSIKSDGTTKASGTIDQSNWIQSHSTDSTANEVVKASGSYVQTHNADGTFSATITLSAPIYNATYTATGTITLPAIAINPTLTINSSTDMTTSGSTINYTLGSTNGRSTKLQYSLNDSSWTDLATKTADGTYTVTLPNLLSSSPNSYTFTVYFRAITGSYSSGSKSKTITISSSIKPSISSVAVSAVNSYSALGSLFVQGLTKPKITTSGATAGAGSTIKQYDLTALGGYNSFSAKTNIGSSAYTYGTALQKSGTYNATIKVIDKRGGNVSKTSANFTVIAYSNPAIQSLKVERCNSDGTLNNNGTKCKLTVKYNISPISSGGTNYNTKKLYYSTNNGSSWTEISISSYSTTISQVINGTYSVASSYNILVKLVDISTTVIQGTTLPTSFVLVSKHTGGDGIAFGAIAESSGLHNHMTTNLHATLNMVVDSTVIPILEIVDE